MTESISRRRRGFVKLCAGAAVTAGAAPRLLAAAGASVREYERVRLVDETQRPLSASMIETGRSYVFNYPYVTTPAFLIDLGREAPGGAVLTTEDGREYRWSGGVGPGRSLVSFCAICTHRMSHPSPSVSFIDYRHEETSFVDREGHPERRAGIIYCCSEQSVYDPLDGARVLGGPAPQPLAAIAIEEAADGTLAAVAVLGAELYDRFFDHFGLRLSIEYGTTHVRRPARGDVVVVPLDHYTRNPVHC